MLVLGDAHADDPDRRTAFAAAYEAADAVRALQVGDLLTYDLPAPTWFVAGNNEDWAVVEALRRGEDHPRATNAHLLASTAATVEGLRVAGLSGNYAPTRYEKPRGALSGDRRRHFVRDDVEAAAALGDVDVLLTHEAPHGLIYYGYDAGSDPVDELIAALEPELCLVGHHHRHAETTRGGTRVVSLAPAWAARYELDPETLELTRHEPRVSAPPPD